MQLAQETRKSKALNRKGRKLRKERATDIHSYRSFFACFAIFAVKIFWCRARCEFHFAFPLCPGREIQKQKAR